MHKRTCIQRLKMSPRIVDRQHLKLDEAEEICKIEDDARSNHCAQFSAPDQSSYKGSRQGHDKRRNQLSAQHVKACRNDSVDQPINTPSVEQEYTTQKGNNKRKGKWDNSQELPRFLAFEKSAC